MNVFENVFKERERVVCERENVRERERVCVYWVDLGLFIILCTIQNWTTSKARKVCCVAKRTSF